MMTITVGVDGPISAQSEFKPAIVSAPVDTENASIVAGHGPILGMPLLVAGLIAFALGVTGFAPVGALVPVLAVVVVGEAVAARLTFRSGDSTRGVLFAALGGFWLTYAGLVVGLSHNWFGVDPAETARSIAVFVIAWLAAALMLTAAALAQPVVYLSLYAIFDLSLVLLLVGTLTGVQGLFTAAGVALLVMCALAAYTCLATTGPMRMRGVLPLGPVLVGDHERQSIRVRATMPDVASPKPKARVTMGEVSDEIKEVTSNNNEHEARTPESVSSSG